MDTERVSDEELAALLGGVDPDEPLHPHTWRLIERALTELQSRRAAQPADRAAIIEECARAARTWAEQFGRLHANERWQLEHRIRALNLEEPAQPAGEVERLREAMDRIGLMVTDTHIAPWARLNGIGEILAEVEARAALNHPGRVK